MKKIITTLLMTLFLYSSVAMADPAEITCVGYGVSESAAIHDALRSALEQHVGILINSKTIVQNMAVVKSMIYSHVEGYILGYDVLKRSSSPEGYKVTVNAKISNKLDLDLMKASDKTAVIDLGFQDARIGIIVMEQNNHEGYGAENIIANGLQKAGFSRIIDMKQFAEAERIRVVNSIFQDDTEAAASFKTQFDVDYMIVCLTDNAHVQQINTRGFEAFKNGKVAFAARMYNTNTGEVIYSNSILASSLETDDSVAVPRAIAKAAEQLTPEIVQAIMTKAARSDQHIQLIVTQSKLGDTSHAENYLGGLQGVSHVMLRSSSYDTMVFDLNVANDTSTFAALLEADGYNIVELASNYIKI